jgi:N-acetylmuramoyl-L-alanine amidase
VHKDFFISYARADQSWAEWIAWRLEAEGFSVIVQAWDFTPGDNFALQMHQASIEAKRTIAVLSPDFFKSAFTQAEWTAAFASDPTGTSGRLLPIRVRECEPEGLFGPIVYIDLVGLDDVTATRRLLEGVSRVRAKPAVSPTLPVTPRPYPGSLPPVWSVPYPRNRNFTGRDDVLTSLRSQLHSGLPAAVTQAISGLGGIGKTQLALEYVYRFASEYRIVWWIRADSEAARMDDLAQLGKALGIEVADGEVAPDTVRKTLAWLERNRGWLLVFDNVEEPNQIKDVLPRSGAGHSIITSRYAFWSEIANTLSLNVWSTQEAVDYLTRRTRQQDADSARRAADLLGCLPLALEQASAYIEQSNIAISKYADLFERHKGRLFRRHNADDPRTTVATIWDISFKRVQEENPGALSLLNLYAFLPPDRIPRLIFANKAPLLPTPVRALVRDELKFDDALATLIRYSLVQATLEFVSIHRLVQLAVRERLNDRMFREFGEAAVRVQSDTADQAARTTDRVATISWLRHPPRWFVPAASLSVLIVAGALAWYWSSSSVERTPTIPSPDGSDPKPAASALPGNNVPAPAGRTPAEIAILHERLPGLRNPSGPEPASASTRTSALVVIDPAHGGSLAVGGSSPNNSTSSSGILEKDLTLELALLIEKAVKSAQASARRPVSVVLTRRSDINLSLQDRVAVAFNSRAAAFVSLHFNAGPDGGNRGVEALVRSKLVNRNYSEDVGLANALAAGVMGVLRRHDPQAVSRGTKDGQLTILTAMDILAMPACLLEVEFIDNPEVDRLLISGPSAFQIRQELAAEIGRILVATALRASQS